jgi:two-component system chemotaxis response regulator CheY
MAQRILIVDDAAFMRMMIKDILSKNGYDVVGEAENGAVAVEKYSELKPDLVTMDITMPEMDGIEA